MPKAKDLPPKEEIKSKSEKPSWVALRPAELEKIVIDLSKQGETPAKIGLVLRDKYGVPKAKLLGKRISQIIKESGQEIPSEKSYVDAEINTLESHIKIHKHDYSAQRSHAKKLWIVNKLTKAAKCQKLSL